MSPRLGVDAQGWANLAPLLDAALDLPAEQRDAWLDSRPGLMAAQRERLRRWLGHADGGRLHTLPKMADATEGAGAGAADDRRAGELVGPYRLIERLGAGGMGVVWLAERADGLIARPVALKLPRRATRRAAEVAERMARERRILASLAHPNIARLYDVGLDADGQPWLALEHVAGERIDLFCAERELGLEQRLRLFLQAADAVAHAHGRLVVHRDLKPSNVLVTTDGELRLLDFGIAGLLDDETAADVSSAACTPGYAAPEQRRGEPVGVGADVYSLGVLLFELLCGVRPGDAPCAASEAAIGRPWRGRLHGDLDAVLARALHPQVDARYASVQAFADELRRFLERRPVSARPGQARHRLALFVRRNARAVLVSSIGLAGLCAATAVSVYQWQRAELERAQAIEVKDFVVATLQQASPYVSGSPAASLPAMLAEARARLDRIEHASVATRVELLNMIGWNQASMGLLDPAAQTVAQARREAEAGLPAAHPQHLATRLTEAVITRHRGDQPAARRALDALLAELRTRPHELPDTRIRALRNSANLAMHEDQPGRAGAEAHEALQLTVQRHGEHHHETLASLGVLANVVLTAGQPQEALAVARRAEAVSVTLFGDVPNARTIEVRETQARAHAALGDTAVAAAMLARCLADAALLHGASSLEVGILHRSLARLWLDRGDAARAHEHADVAARVLAERSGAGSKHVGDALVLRARAALVLGQGAQALADLEAAQRIRARQFGPDHAKTLEAASLRTAAQAPAPAAGIRP